MGALNGSREMKDPLSVMTIKSTPTMMQPSVKAVTSFMAGQRAAVWRRRKNQ